MLTKLKSEYEKKPDSIETNRAIAEYYVSKDLLEEAEPYLVKMLDIDEEIVSAHNQLGVICFKRSQYNDAEYHFKKALHVDSKATEAQFNLAFLYQTQGKFAEALPHYREVVTTDGDDPEVYHLMGQCAQAAGILEEAEAFLVESFRLAPTVELAIDLSVLYISQEKYPEAEDLLAFLLDLVDNETEKQHPDAYTNDQLPALNLNKDSLNFTLGLVLAKQGKYMNAIKCLRDVVMMDDGNEQAYNYLGECCAAIGLHKEAGSFFAKASRIDPQYLQPIASLGKLHYNREEYHKAIAAMERYIAAQGQETVDVQDPETELVYKLLGRAYLQIGNKEKASEIWKESLERNPNQPELTALIDGTG
ncbi:tetratricopeptide repeat protein [Candidatus Poribacteria bacterium]